MAFTRQSDTVRFFHAFQAEIIALALVPGDSWDVGDILYATDTRQWFQIVLVGGAKTVLSLSAAPIAAYTVTVVLGGAGTFLATLQISAFDFLGNPVAPAVGIIAEGPAAGTAVLTLNAGGPGGQQLPWDGGIAALVVAGIARPDPATGTLWVDATASAAGAGHLWVVIDGRFAYDLAVVYP